MECQEFEEAANLIIQGLEKLGFQPDEYNFKDTPKRFSRAYCEIFEGCKDTDGQIKEILSTAFPSEGIQGIVVAKDIVCFSMCPHHLLPVEYHVCVGYIPSKDGKVLGISKLARLVEVLSKQPMLQETFTSEIVDNLMNVGVQGAVALVEGRHMCMRMRGVRSINSSIITQAVRGLFDTDPSTKSEFMEEIKDRMKF